MRTVERCVAALVVLVAGAVVVAAPPDADRAEAALVPAGQTRRLQTKSKMAIRSMSNGKDNVVKVGPDPMDTSRVVLTGMAPGVSRLKLTDVGGKTEEVIVVVE